MAVAKMTSKGQITIPASVRRKLGLGKGSYVSFSPLGESYALSLVESDPLDELEGFFAYSGSAHSVDEMNAAIDRKAKALLSDSD